MVHADVRSGTGDVQAVRGFQELWTKEDWWAVWVGFAIIAAAYLAFVSGGSIGWIAVVPAKWSNLDALSRHFLENVPRYVAQYVVWNLIIGLPLAAMGISARRFVPAFALLYLLALAVFTAGQWDQAVRYNLEPPLVALALGLVLSNVVRLPRLFEPGFRVEFYIKTGIVLLGATLPFALIAWAGPAAVAQASIVSIVTFVVIFKAATLLGLERRHAAVLGVGGAVCGVSAAIAVAGAVGAKKSDTANAITAVVVWSIIMIFFLPFAAHWLGLPAGIAGAWIGTSEFADAAGIAAAQAYSALVGQGGIEGRPEQVVQSFTLMKIVGRDVWIGIWAFVLAIVATTRWERNAVTLRPDAAQIWQRFPKFVLGFVAASLFVSWLAGGNSLSNYNREFVPALVAPIKDIRSWFFIFCFLSIGLTTRLRDLAYDGPKPLLAFSAGVLVNVALGLVLSLYVFANFWLGL